MTLPEYGQPIARLPAGGGVSDFGDNVKLFFGDDDDSSIYYDSTDMIINPKEFGVGILRVMGDVAFGDGDVAAAGTIRLPNASNIVFRNAANSGDIVAVQVDGSDNVIIGNTGNGNTIYRTETGFIHQFDQTIMVNETINTFMTIGLTINQDANDDDILTFKSSDVSQPATAFREANTYGTFLKFSPASGGLLIVGLKDADGTPGNALAMIGMLGEAADTSQTTSGIGVVNFQSSVTDGGTGRAAVAAGGNCFVIDNFGTAAFIIDGAGNLYANGGASTTAVTIFDEIDDLQMVRAFDLARAEKGAGGLIASRFDGFLKYNEGNLVEVGILGAPLAEGGLINITRLQQMHNGAIWQLYTKLEETQRELAALQTPSLTLKGIGSCLTSLFHSRRPRRSVPRPRFPF